MSDTSAVFLVTVNYYDANAAAERTLYFSTGVGFVSSDSDTPDHTVFDPRLIQPLDVTRTMFSPRAIRGASTVGIGDIRLQNRDGALDDIINWGLDGREVKVYRGPSGGAFPADFTLDLVATVQIAECDQQEARIILRDRQAEVNKALQATKYAGSGLGTLEGTADTIKGKPKPIALGKVFNATPAIVEPAKLIYQVHDAGSCTVDEVYDEGAELTDDGSTYANTTDLLDDTKAPASGEFKVYSGSEGTFFRLGATPAGTITANVTQGANDAARTVAQVWTQLLTRAGMDSSDWSTADVTALDTAASYVVGWYWDAETTVNLALDTIASSVYAAWYVDKDGVFRIKRFAAPSGSAVHAFTPNDVIADRVQGLTRVRPNDPGNGIPTYKTIVRYQHNFTIQNSAIAAAVTVARRAFIAQEWREAVDTDATVQTKHLLAPQAEYNTALTVEADAVAEAGRIQDLHGTRRDLFELTAALDDDTADIDLNDVVELAHPRYGLGVEGDDLGELGSAFRVIGIQADGIARQITFTLWGSPEELYNIVTDGGAYSVTDTGAYGYAEAA